MARRSAVCALALGRKGSTGFPGKNTTMVLGKPLAYFPMKVALDAPSVTEVYLSTDDEQLMALGRGIGVEIIARPPKLATKEALGEDAFLHGFKVIRDKLRQKGDELELLVLLFCNAATILPETIEEGIRILRENPSYDSAVTVSCYNMWSPLRARRIGEDNLLRPFVPLESFGDPATLNCDRDSQGDAWFADMGVSIVRPRCLENIHEGLLPQKWMGRRIYPLKQWGGLDVDYEWQMPSVEFWLSRHGYSERGERKKTSQN